MLESDWQKIRAWYRQGFIELGAACVALGNPKDECAKNLEWARR